MESLNGQVHRRESEKGGSSYKFDPLDHPICLSSPRRTVPFPSWRQHVPFAMLLVSILKPRTLVELGVHYGDSYCAFCQAVAELRLGTSCYGVDTWKGDPHASLYGPEVLADLTAHHDPLYGAFSRLIQSSFDEALQHFMDGAIDILHIDGYHTYRAVKHDFDTWLPKLSPRGVILLHDINVKQQDFGVWKVWDEVKVGYPHFEFLHCHGLGLIAVGEKPPEELKWLFEADDEKAAAIRHFFFYLGERLTDKEALSAKQALANALESEVESLRADRIELKAIRSSTTWRVAKRLRNLIAPMRSATLVRWIRYFVRIPSVAFKVISTEGWAGFRIKIKNWSHKLASGQLSREIAFQNGSSPDRHDNPHFAQEIEYISKILEMLKSSDQTSDFRKSHVLDVVVPIYNAYEDFLKCLYSLLKYQDIYGIVLLHDCSTDMRVKSFLQTLKEFEQERFKIEENPKNLGYLKTANKGMRITKYDVVLLNTDTVVTLGWARKMRACAYSDDKIATVTPFTNNGRMCSVPEFLENNEIPEGFTVDSFAECVENASANRYPDLVTAVGFCMYIRRSVIDEIGYFDDVNFGMGYGEEVDFSFRAARKGYKNVLCDDTFVFHKGRASFLDTQDTVLEKHHRVVAEKYPDLWAAVAVFERSNPLKVVHDRLRAEMRRRGFRDQRLR